MGLGFRVLGQACRNVYAGVDRQTRTDPTQADCRPVAMIWDSCGGSSSSSSTTVIGSSS